MRDEADRRWAPVVQALVTFVSNAIRDGSLRPGSIWMLDLVRYGDVPELSRKKIVS